MPVKHFIINPNKVEVSKEAIAASRERLEDIKLTTEEKRVQLNREIINETEDLKTVENRIVIKMDIDFKNSHTFENGTKIRLERKYDNFDRKYTMPVNGIVVDAKDIPTGAQVICHHNSCHENNRIFDYKPLSAKSIESDIQYFSIPVSECFAWHDGTQWQSLPGFDFALRVFKPYTGPIQGIEPELIKNVLYVTTGEFVGKVCYMLRSCDYELVFQDVTGREGRLIRIRTTEDTITKREMEVVAIDHDMTEKVKKGYIYVGLNKTDAKAIK